MLNLNLQKRFTMELNSDLIEIDQKALTNDYWFIETILINEPMGSVTGCKHNRPECILT